MNEYLKFYINGSWVEPHTPEIIEVINPADEEAYAQISAGNGHDVDRAVEAARKAFVEYSRWSIDQRTALLERVLEVYQTHYDQIADAISLEMGAPIDLARGAQTKVGINHIQSAIKTIVEFEFEKFEDGMIISYEPIGVCGLITPWNWPINQVAAKVMPALAAGCTMILKPSEESPIDAMILAKVLHEAGVPSGVFNLVNGYGSIVGEAMSRHPGIDMMSFTGSTRGGIAVAKASADTVKRVAQELGGKSANIILKDTDIAKAVADGVENCMSNSGQSCNAPSRMLVPKADMSVAIEAAAITAKNMRVDDPSVEGDHLGPVVNRTQFEKIQNLIKVGINEGARLVAGGLGRPEHLERGYYVKPTVFANVTSDMTIAREEIFGPVIVIMEYESEEQAIEIANNTEYGLAGFVSSSNLDHAVNVAKKIRAGQVSINYIGDNTDTPFGGFKQSGNGRENGCWGLGEFLEVKAIMGAAAPS
ncbi:MAG: aldehyde dehydrogenase (NAD+) [Parasphingorhabdus sp.]|jgi:aldehyde dehydrogenase (NAD+)